MELILFTCPFQVHNTSILYKNKYRNNLLIKIWATNSLGPPAFTHTRITLIEWKLFWCDILSTVCVRVFNLLYSVQSYRSSQISDRFYSSHSKNLPFILTSFPIPFNPLCILNQWEFYAECSCHRSHKKKRQKKQGAQIRSRFPWNC